MGAVNGEAPASLLERVQELQNALDECAGPVPRELVDELIGAVVQMYGAGLGRILDTVLGGPDGEPIATALAEDPLISTLLLIHDLHPVGLESRVQAALDSVRPYMESHGGNVELLSLEDGVARIHLRGSCSDCSASAMTLELAIKQALEEQAPDLEGLEVEGVAPQTMGGSGLPMVTGSGLPMAGGSADPAIELPITISSGAPAPPAAPAWHELEGLTQPAEGTLTRAAVGPHELMIANVEGTLLAYRDLCAGCGAEMHEGRLTDGVLACPQCERSYFLPRAGRSVDGEGLQLTPVPLLCERGHVKVAVAG